MISSRKSGDPVHTTLYSHANLEASSANRTEPLGPNFFFVPLLVCNRTPHDETRMKNNAVLHSFPVRRESPVFVSGFVDSSNVLRRTKGCVPTLQLRWSGEDSHEPWSMEHGAFLVHRFVLVHNVHI